MPARAKVWRGFELKWGYDAFNPGFGDTKFAPIRSAVGHPVPSMYGGVDDVVVLLETVLHDVHQDVDDRLVFESVVRKWGLALVRLPRDLRVADLRDGALADLGIAREELVSSTAEHYPCTRAWAASLHAADDGIDGIVWHSRQAELHQPGSRREVFVLWGDRAPSGRRSARSSVKICASRNHR